MITGATGYIGSNLARRLVSMGEDVHIITRRNSSFLNIADIVDSVNVFVFENNIDQLACFFEKIKPDLVYHLASYFVAEHKPDDVGALIESNLKFGTYILEAMRVVGVKSFINTSTSWQHYNNSMYDPVCLYAATKEAFEKIIEYYTNVCGFRVITLELYDTYGPKDKRKKLLNLLRQYANTGSLLDMSMGQQILDILYIDDVIDAYVLASDYLSDLDFCQHKKYSLQSANRYTLKDIVDVYEKIAGVKCKINWGARPYRIREVMIPPTCVEKLPGWEAKITLEEGIKRMLHADEECE